MRYASLFFSLLGMAPAAQAMDAFEIQVYDGKINEIGEYTLETHVNHVFSAKLLPDFEGQVPYAGITHVTFEFARGMTPWWEMGAYLQTAYTPGPSAHWAGAKVRAKFVLPNADKTRLHLGANVEISKIPTIFEDSSWGLELRPILGYAWDWVTLLFNPILDVALSAESQVPSFEPAMKVMIDTHHDFGLGVEYYSDLGELNAVGPVARQEHYLFGAFDLLNKPLELNVGAGSGFTDVSNGLVVKMIVGVAL